MSIEEKEKTRHQKNRPESIPLIAVTALMSEHVLAREWLRPEEEAAWEYL
jgi:hypothetical protein